MWWASWSEYVPSGSPGKQRLGFLPSAGETNAALPANIAGLTIGTATTVPESAAVSRLRMNRPTAAMPEYSQA